MVWERLKETKPTLVLVSRETVKHLAEAALTPHWPLSERRPATPEAERLGWNGLFRGISWTWEADRALAFSLQLAEVFRPSLGDLLPTLLSKLDGGGIFLLCQRSEGLTLSPPGIMHHDQRRAYPNPGQFLKMLLANTHFG